VSNTIGDAAATGFSTSASHVVPQADLQSVFTLRAGFPAATRPALDAGFGAAGPGERPYTSVGFFERDRPTSLSCQYNFNVQQEKARDTVLEIGYMANVSHHLTANDLSINQVAPVLTGPGDAQARRPFPQFSNVFIINPAVGDSTYHAGYIRVERRFSRGFAVLGHYTFSKFMDDVASGNEYGDPSSYMDAYNRRLDKSRSGTDVPHRLIISGLYEVRDSARRTGWREHWWAHGASECSRAAVGAAVHRHDGGEPMNAFSAGPLRSDLVADPVLGASGRSIAGSIPRRFERRRRFVRNCAALGAARRFNATGRCDA
jgi:hypothetical protein